MADREVTLRFRVTDDGTLRVFDQAEQKLKQVERAAKDTTDNAATGFGRLSGEVEKLTKQFGALVGGALGARAMFEVGRAAIGAAADFEQLETRLVSLSGSTVVAQRRFEEFKQLAATTPFDVKGIVSAGISLEAFGAQADATLKGVADLAAFMGTDVVEAAQSFGRAWAAGAGAADVLRERGVLALVAMRAGVDDLTKLSLPEFRRVLFEAMVDPAGKIAGSTDLLAKTWIGAISNIGDAQMELLASMGEIVTESEVLRGALVGASDAVRAMAGAIRDWTAANRELVDSDFDLYLQSLGKVLSPIKTFFDDIAEGVRATNEQLDYFGDKIGNFIQSVNQLAHAMPDWLVPEDGFLNNTSMLATGASGDSRMREQLLWFSQNFGRGVSLTPEAAARIAAGETAGIDPNFESYLYGSNAGFSEQIDFISQAQNVAAGLNPDGSPKAVATRRPDFGEARKVVTETARATKEAGETATKAAAEVAQLTDQYGRLVTQSRDVAGQLRAVTGELETQTQTISLDFGEAFRRLTTGGADADILGVFTNATQAAAADAFDAILGEKLRFDFEIERNFAQDLPGFFESGMESIKSIFSDSTADLVSTSQSASGQIGQAFGRSFDGIAQGGQALAQQLSGLGVPVVGGTQVPLSPSFGNLAGGQFGQAGGQFVAIDAFGSRFSGSDAGSVAGAASGQFGGGGGAGLTGGAIAGGAALIGAVASELITQLQEEEEVRIGRLRATRPAGVDVGGLTTTGALAGLGVGAAVTGVGVATGAITGATLGSAVPVIGTIIGAALGALVGAIASLFETKPQRSDLIQKGIGKLVAENPSFIEQGNFKASGRRGIEADRLFRPTEDRRAFFESLGIAFDANTDQFTIEQTLREGKFADGVGNVGRDANGNLISQVIPNPDRVALENLILADPNNLEEQLRLPAFGLAAALTGGNAKDTADATNTLINNILLTGQEFSEEARRQLLAVADAAGLDLFNTIEQLGINFTLAQNRFDDRGGRKPTIDRDETIRAIEGVVELFSDDIPKGVDALALATENLGEKSFNTAGFFEDLTRQIEIFGELADNVGRGLKDSIGAGIAEPTGRGVLASGGSLQDAVRAVRQQGSAFVSTLSASIRDGMSVAITEGVFDAVEDSASWQALTDRIADAVKNPALIGSLPALIGDVFNANAAQLEAGAFAQQELQRRFGALPTTLFAQSDAFRERAEDLRFGRLTPEQQQARIDRDIQRVGARIFGIYSDDIDDTTQAPLLAELFGELGQLGERRASLADALFPGGGVANERRREAFFAESLGFVDSAATGLGNLGQQQKDALTAGTEATKNLTESTDSLADRIDRLTETIIEMLDRGVSMPLEAVVTRFAELMGDIPRAREHVKDIVNHAR